MVKIQPIRPLQAAPRLHLLKSGVTINQPPPPIGAARQKPLSARPGIRPIGGRAVAVRRVGADDETISRHLCKVLRHDAAKHGLHLRPDGYVKLSDYLALEFCTARNIREADIRRVVANNDKQRFGIDHPPGETEPHIRCHQGHTAAAVVDEALLTQVTSAEELPLLCHGTFLHAWPAIAAEGLRTMGRHHVHCVVADLTKEENQGVVMSGSRGECDVVVFIDAAAALGEGMILLWSENNVVLTRGHDGVIPPHLFSGVSFWDYEAEAWFHEDYMAADSPEGAEASEEGDLVDLEGFGVEGELEAAGEDNEDLVDLNI